MKKLFLLLIITAMAVTAAVAQEKKETTPAPTQKDVKPAPEQKDMKPATDQVKQDRAEWEKKFKEDLKLTEEQSQKYDALNKEYSDKIDAIGKDASLDKDALKEKKMGLKKEKEAKFLEILTPEQQSKYKEMRETMEKKNASKQGY
jgi:Spy/CpxP family protein refolding chaperone